MFSKACEYAIKAAIFIAGNSMVDKRVNLSDIVTEIDSPIAFTAKILQQLVKFDIIESTKGPGGGFHIDKSKLPNIQLSQIVFAIDGDKVFNGCGLGLTECNVEYPCPVHDKFLTIRENLKKMTRETSLYELANGLNQGHTFLKR